MLISLDPGLRGCGVAAWTSREAPYILREATYIKGTPAGSGPDAWGPLASDVWLWARTFHGLATDLALEIPQVYRVSPGDPNDLIQLAGVLGAVVGVFGLHVRAVAYRPAEWKGQIPKEIHHRRILAALSEDETGCIRRVGRTLQHNVTDAIGIGLFHLRKLGLR